MGRSGRSLSGATGAWRFWVLPTWLVLVALTTFVALGSSALVDPDEGRNATAGLEMMQGGEWMLPTLNGLPFLDKPFLFFASVGASLKLFGVTEFAARLPSALSSLLLVLLVARFAGRRFGSSNLAVAGIVLATTPLMVVFSRIVIFDMMLALFVSSSLLAFFEAIDERAGGSTTRGLAVAFGVVVPWSAVAWLAVTLGVLVKGPVALLFPLVVALPYAVRRKATRAVLHPSALLMLLAFAWVGWLEARVPGFLRYALVTETWGRLTSDDLNRNGPIWYFAPVLLGGALPWIFVVAYGLREAWQRSDLEQRRTVGYLILWIVVPLAFFTLSQSKRPQYILPLMPPLAVMTSWVLTSVSSVRRARAAAIAGCSWLLLGGLIALAASGLFELDLRMPPAAASAVVSGVFRFGLLALLCGVATIWWRRRLVVTVVLLSLPMASFAGLVGAGYSVTAEGRSGRELAKAMGPLVEQGARVYGLETFLPSLEFYLDQPTIVGSAVGEPLRSNYVLADYPQLVEESPLLRPATGLLDDLVECELEGIVLLKASFGEERRRLERVGARLLFANRKVVAYDRTACERSGQLPKKE